MIYIVYDLLNLTFSLNGIVCCMDHFETKNIYIIYIYNSQNNINHNIPRWFAVDIDVSTAFEQLRTELALEAVRMVGRCADAIRKTGLQHLIACNAELNLE